MGSNAGSSASKNASGGESSPGLGPHLFRPCGAMAGAYRGGIVRPGEHGGYPVAELDHGICVAAEPPAAAQQVQAFGPEAFGRVMVARMAGIIDLAAGAQGGDFLRLPLRRVVFPQDEHRVRIVGVFGAQRQRRARAVYQARRAGRRVDRNRPDMRRRVGPCGHHFADHVAQAVEIILRMLAEARFRRGAVFLSAPARVAEYRVGDCFACRGIHQKGTHGIRAVVDAYDVCFLHGSLGVDRVFLRLVPAPFRRAGNAKVKLFYSFCAYFVLYYFFFLYYCVFYRFCLFFICFRVCF